MEKKYEVKIEDLPFLSPLMKAYLAEDEAIRQLYAHAFSLDGFEQAIESRKAFNTNRNVLVEVLKSQYTNLPKQTELESNIDLLLQPNTFTITAAHQPCLFLGPLFNLFKISGTIVTARLLKEKYPQYNFVPVFWMGSEDHDKEELCNTNVGGIRIDWNNAYSGVIGKFGTDGLANAIEAFKAASPLFNAEYVSIIEKGIASTSDFGQLTQYLTHELFKEFGLVVIDQNDARLKALFADIIRDEVFEQRAEKVLQPQIEWLEQHYSVQAKPRAINFFYIQPGSRDRIVRNGEGFTTANQLANFSANEMDKEISTQPERFSPNVFFRPLFQEYILPNLGFIGGAGELSYWLELKPLFDYYKVPYPMQLFRSMGMLTGSKTLTKMEKLNTKPLDYFGDKNSFIKQWLSENSMHDVSVDNEKAKLEAIFDELVKKAIAIDKSLEGSIKGELQRSLNGLDAVAGKLLKAEKRNQETALQQIESVHQQFFPNGTLMERSENLFSAIGTLNKEEFKALVLAQNPLEKSFNIFSN